LLPKPLRVGHRTKLWERDKFDEALRQLGNQLRDETNGQSHE
jgi:hypothetical protein